MAGLSMIVFRGIHFKNGGEEVDFGVPPPREARSSYLPGFDRPTWRAGTTYLGGDESLGFERPKDKGLAKNYELEREMDRARQAMDIPRLRMLYRQADRESSTPDGAIRERIDLLTEIGPQRPEGLGAYLAGKPMAGQVGSVLRPYAEYDAIVKGAEQRPQEAARKFIALAERYPDSKKAPAALIMAARMLTRDGRPGYPTEDLHLADSALRKLLSRYPDSRFTWHARGGLGRIEFLQKRYDAAIRHYRRQLRERETPTALASLEMCEKRRGNRPGRAEVLLRLIRRGDLTAPGRAPFVFEAFTDRDSREFRRRLLRDPGLADTYIEYRINYTRAGKDLLPWSDVNGLSGRSYAQLAGVALKLRDGSRTRSLAQRALGMRDAEDSHALATFILASLARRAGDLDGARRKYASILRRWPKSYLTGGARENLVLLEERLGNLAEALDHVSVLGMPQDFAYLADVRMTSAQLANYIRTRPQHPRRNDLTYTLGIRYLREANWTGAEGAFAMLSARERRNRASQAVWNSEGEVGQDPAATMKALRTLHRAVDRAGNRQAKAKALYALGGYDYRHRHLLLYCAPVWQGWRSVGFGFSWNDSVARPEDDRALERHHEAHEALAQALRHFRRIVRDYPETPEAPKAAYWGACSAERLADFSPYWRWRERKRGLMGEAVRLMRFAQRAKDPELAAKARKYTLVFRRFYEQEQGAFAEEGKAARRFRGTETSPRHGMD